MDPEVDRLTQALDADLRELYRQLEHLQGQVVTMQIKLAELRREEND